MLNWCINEFFLILKNKVDRLKSFKDKFIGLKENIEYKNLIELSILCRLELLKYLKILV